MRSIAHGLANYIIKQHKTAGKKSKKDDKKKEETTKVEFCLSSELIHIMTFIFMPIFRISTQKTELK